MAIQSDLISQNLRRPLDGIVRDLHHKYDGVFGTETIESLVVDSFVVLAARATVTRWLVLGTQRLAGERLDALVHAENPSTNRVPAALFLCTHNAGRSQMALGWFSHLAGTRAVAWSGGSEPEGEINPVAVEAMAEVGIDISQGYAKPWTEEVLRAAGFVITMGCGDACPLVPGKHYEDWDVADPAGQRIATVRLIRDELELRVRDLVTRMPVDRREDPIRKAEGSPAPPFTAAGTAAANETTQRTPRHSGRGWSIKNRLTGLGRRSK